MKAIYWETFLFQFAQYSDNQKNVKYKDDISSILKHAFDVVAKQMALPVRHQFTY